MVGVGSEPYPPPQYYGAPPCYQHPPQRVPYIEYRCPCPMNAFPKNVHIGPATGKAPTGGGPDAASAPVAPPGGAFRPKVRAARALDHADTHGSGKDPPREPEPPAAADAPRPSLLPAALGGASPKRELYDVRDNLRLAGDTPGPAEAVGPPSPARGSAGACAPQPPPVAPRRARLGKAMARRSLAGDDTGLLLSAPQPPPAPSVEVDDDVLAISPPASVPIDLSSSDETERRSIPLVDVKKENEGPTQPSPRKSDALALREHNSTAVGVASECTDIPKPVKRRYSKPKLEIELCDMELNDSCRTNGIGEHVKLQKRRKVTVDQSEPVFRIETTPDTKKKVATKQKSVPKNTQSAPKKNLKRKSDSILEVNMTKKTKVDGTIRQDEDQGNKVVTLADDKKEKVAKPKNKSALLLDNLIRKNSIDRPDTKSFDLDAPLNPAELFFNENETSNCGKKSLNINNNIVDESISISNVHLNAIAAVTQHINKKIASGKMACKTEKSDKEESKESAYDLHPTKAVLNTPLKKLCLKEEHLLSTKLDDNITKNSVKSLLKLCSKIPKSEKVVKKLKITSSENEIKEKSQSKISEHNKNCVVDSPLTSITTDMVPEKLCANVINSKLGFNKTETKETELSPCEKTDTQVPCSKVKAMDLKIVEKDTIEKISTKTTSKLKSVIDNLKSQKPKLNNSKHKSDNNMGEVKEKVVKLLVSKKPAIKSDEAAAVIEEACASPVARCAGRRSRRKRSASRRLRRPVPPLTLPVARELRAPPRWSNGWTWDGEPYVSKVYLNNDARLDRPARCWSRMTHTSGDCVARGDCVLLRASSARAQPFVARVARLWENPEDGEMMVSLVWYYRPEHTERGRQPEDAPDEVFASRHRDANSVACIEDKCYVLTFNEYCRLSLCQYYSRSRPCYRGPIVMSDPGCATPIAVMMPILVLLSPRIYRKRLKATEEGVTIPPSVVPPMPSAEVTPAVAINDTKLPPSVSPELVLFCRKIYDFRSKKIVVPNK
ncbi:Bromo adjacent homology domain-containing 1 protein [Eumeta japonica]|uniref:Bromo adjacent homology domain-containing 1 protein n=1 Tax=Eumeta variegata TaxID=151549 RepID=A0A4C1T3Z3_EUMVA|nr:Bromo adjacent homology domain-containing 1 protein [Eumeta japonica]